MALEVKICGVKTAEALDTAVTAGARLVGFVFFPPSSRALRPAAAAALAQRVPPGVLRVGLVVDADDATLDAILSEVPLDLLQLHGHESLERVAAVRARFGLPLIKAVAVEHANDLAAAEAYAAVADRLLFDARPPKGAILPGGNARSFDWRLLAGRSWPRPWLLAGGLNTGNLAEAVRLSGAVAVDVSSGVEDAPGHKSATLIRSFMRVAARIDGPSPVASGDRADYI